MDKEVLTREDVNYEVASQRLGHIINYNEYVVLEIMREVYDKDNELCKCSLCVEDIYALALNKTPPRYIQPTNIEIYKSNNNFISKAEIKKHVLEAIKVVKEKPSH
jgi:competence protein ComFB